MIIAMANDIRVVLIKLADRCTTCARSSICPLTAAGDARETMEIYANRASPRYLLAQSELETCRFAI